MNKKKLAVLKLILLFSLIVVLPIILYLTCKNTLFNAEWLRNLPVFLEQYKNEAILILIGLQILQVVICVLPGQPIQFAASYMFGVVGGYLISIVGAIIGATIAFFLAKLLGAQSVMDIFGKEKVENYRRKINSGKGLLLVFIIYVIPGLPKDLVGYVAGISNMGFLPYIVISSIGRSPGMLGSLFVGKFFQSGNYFAIGVLAVICLIIFYICWKKRDSIIGFMDKVEQQDEMRKAEKNGKANK